MHGGGIQDKSRKVPEKFGGKEAGKVGGKEAGKAGGKMLLNKPLKGKKKPGGAATALPTPPT